MSAAPVFFSRCVVVGAGLLGASLAGAGKAAGLFGRVVAVGRSRANLDVALGKGLVDEVHSALEPALAGADLVVLATPVATALAQLEDIARLGPPTAMLTDVGSVKAPIVLEARRLGLASRFLGAHPLAGKAEVGAAAADPHLFEGRRVILTPEQDTPEGLVSRMRAMWEALGSRVVTMPASEHDTALASSSHLPQMVAFALAACVDASPLRDGIVACIAGGFRDTTRLASSDPDMWADIVRLNREAVVEAMDDFTEAWEDLRDAVATRNDTAFRELVARARRLRKDIAS